MAMLSPIIETFDGTGSVPADYIQKFTGTGTTTTSTLTGSVWQIRSGTNPVAPNRWIRPLTGAEPDGVTQYKIEVDYQSLASVGATLRINIDDSGSVASNKLITFNAGAGPVTSLGLSSTTLSTRTLVFTVPAGSPAPHLQIDGANVAGRGIDIFELRIRPVIAYRELASPVGRNALITADDLGYPDWLSDPSCLRYTPELLEGGIRPGVDLNWQGSPILPKISNASTTRLVTLNVDLDYDFVGSSAWASSTPLSSASSFTGGRNVRFTGVDTGGRRWSMQRMRNLYVEGGRGDYRTTPEDDFCYIGGNASSPTDPNATRHTLQNMYAWGVHGTNRGHNVPNALAQKITANASKVIRVQLTSAATNPVVVGADVIIAGTEFGGQSLEQVGFNGTFEITQKVSDAEFYAKPNPGTVGRYGSVRPANAETDSTVGAVWVMTVDISGTNASHSDGAQFTWGDNNDKISREARLHMWTVLNNYCGFISSDDFITRISTWQYIYTSTIYPLLYPNDDGTEFARIGPSAIGAGSKLKEIIDAWAVLRPAYDIADQISPSNGSGGSAGGGAVGIDYQGGRAVTFNRDEFRGGFRAGRRPGGVNNFADLGFGYVANKRYWGEKTADANSLQQVLFDGSLNIPANASPGTRVGLLSTQHTLGDHSGRIDFSFDPDGHPDNMLHIQGREIVTTGNQRNATLNVKVNATLRGTQIAKQIPLTFTTS